MKHIGTIVLLTASIALVGSAAEGGGEFGAFAASTEWTPPTDPEVQARLREWQDWKLGLLIHWGTYSQWGIVESWSLVTTRHSWNKRPERFAGLDDNAYRKVYEELPASFNPTRFDAGKWAAAARDAGVKYALLTSKHHDGFCMFDTATTDYKITSPKCAFHADPRADAIREFSEAFRGQGLRTGIYFSKADWHHPDFWLPELPPGSGQGPNYNPLSQPERWRRFKEFTWKQVEELMSGYGKQDILWLDAGSVRPPNADIDMNGLAAMSRRHQPGLIVVDRTVHGPNENYVTPEGEIPERYLPYPWETCMSMDKKGWTWRPNSEFRSAGTLIRNLCRIVARGGNYLIGIGPDGSGEFSPVVYERLSQIGAWLRLNGEAIFETRPIAPHERGDCVFTQRRDGTTYAIVLAKDDGAGPPEKVVLPAELLAGPVEITLLGHGVLPSGPGGEIAIPESVRNKPPCEHAWTLKLARPRKQPQ
ncbi:MAG: alpha-L-fucosidase [Kiritimatiellae bacterium]|nr:alpha-L-fucosidase [Kiritimatiellia bacterium]